MATSKEYLEFIMEQLSELEEITCRSMMGEYIIYHRGKIAAYLCDDRLLVKPVTGAVKMLPEAPMEPPYKGAKEMLLVEEVDDKAFLANLFEAMYPELPEPKRKESLKIKQIPQKDVPEALDLIWEVFCEFEAPEYPEEGVQEFRGTLDNKSFISKMKFYGAYENDKLVGVLSMRSPQHISMFFVKASHHRRGIGRKLFERMRKDYSEQKFTVNAAPYALEIYRRLGFVETDGEQETNGVRYTPMRFCEE